METKRLCRCCGVRETFGKDGLCIVCRKFDCAIWELVRRA